jgi:hypothetical protein
MTPVMNRTIAISILISIMILISWDWTTGNGLRASNVTPSGVLEESFASYDLRTSEGKASASSSKMETNVVGSPRRGTMANALWCKSQSYNL